MSHIFISYSTRNRDYASHVADKLRDEGFDVWIDNARLRASEDWWRSIVLALRGCAAVVVILTAEADASDWVQREITLAGKYKKPIFPLWLDGSLDTPNWEYFVRIQVEDVRGGKLPPPRFLEHLAEVTPRRHERGADLTPSAAPDPPKLDADLAAEMSPPLPETPPIAVVERKMRWILPLILLAAVAFVAILFTLIRPHEISTKGREILLSEVKAQLTLVRDDVERLQRQYQTVLGGGTLNCGVFFNNPSAYDTTGASNEPDIAAIITDLNTALENLAAAKVPYEQACPPNNTPFTAAEVGGPIVQVVQTLQVLEDIDNALAAANG